MLATGNIAGLGWRSIFLVNVPVGLVSLILSAIHVPESTATGPKRLDIPGVVLVSVALFALIHPLIQGQSAGWPRGPSPAWRAHS